MYSRNFCFTLNNYTTEDEYNIKSWTLPKYLIFGHELGENETPHLQGYVEFKHGIRLKSLKKFNPKIHWEKRLGTPLQASTYCKKEDKEFFEKGKISKQGKRSDIENVTEQILKGKSITDVAQEYPIQYVKFHRGIHSLKTIYDSHKTKFRHLKVLVYWGDTGTGKTRRAIEHNADYFKLDFATNIWWDGYDGQKTLILDDFYGWIPFGQLLNILDGYPLRLQIKGSFAYAKWDKVILTSNIVPNQWYNDIDGRQFAALQRRITKIKMFK